jgi:hypothetical protein
MRYGICVPNLGEFADPPVWIGCNWPNRRPLRRAAQWDGVAPQMINPALSKRGASGVIAQVAHGAPHPWDPFDLAVKRHQFRA